MLYDGRTPRGHNGLPHRSPRRGTILAGLLAILLLVGSAGGRAEVPPAKPYGQLVDEVAAFLMSDVGDGGIRTNDNDPDGYPVPPYFYHFAIFDMNRLWSSTTTYPWHASISYPAYTASVAIDAFLDYHRYSGLPGALERARDFADWLLEHRTPPGDLYGSLPYSTQAEGVMGGGWDDDAIMPDKAAMFAVRLLRLYDATEEPAYLNGALEIADVLAATQLGGGPEDDGRWPFRVRPEDGAVRQDYTSHLQPAVRLFAALAARTGDPAYVQARDRAWQWLLANPCNPASPQYMRWEAFYEDQSPAQQIGFRDHYSAHEMIVELLARRPPGWEQLCADILDWSAGLYLVEGEDQGLGPYVPATLEWEGWPEATYAASLQFARTALLLDGGLAGHPLLDPDWISWAQGMAAACSHGQNQRGIAADGRMYTTLKDITQTFVNRSWYEQNFNTVKYYLELMGLDPALAPADEPHMLRSDHEVRWIVYPPQEAQLRYAVAGGEGRELLRLPAAPAEVRAGGELLPSMGTPADPGPGWYWDPAAGLLTVVHAADPVEVASGLSAAGADHKAWMLETTSGSQPSVALTLSGPARCTVTLYDLRGRLVRVLLAREELPAGRTDLRWDGRDGQGRAVPSGIYLCRLEAGNRVLTGKLTLLR
jgi:hypothetical protein